MDYFLAQLQEALRGPLPGAQAQYQMAHLERRFMPDPPVDVRIACVMALLFPRGGDWQLTLIRRQARDPRDAHAGQIGFPGGKQEPTDPSLAFTALREVEEEIGVPASHIEVLGQLSQLYIPVSNFLVHPFVGYLNEEPHFVPQEEEVSEVLDVPFHYLTNPHIRKKTTVKVANRFELNDVPYFDIHGQVLWGATAMMLSELLELTKQPA